MYRVCVGSTTVGAFTHLDRVKKCLSMLAAGCNARIEKCPPIQTEKRRAKCHSNEARQTTNRVGYYTRYPRKLKPGEFKL